MTAELQKALTNSELTIAVESRRTALLDFRIHATIDFSSFFIRQHHVPRYVGRLF